MSSLNAISDNTFTPEQERELCQTPKAVGDFILTNSKSIGKILGISNLYILILQALHAQETSVKDSEHKVIYDFNEKVSNTWRNEFEITMNENESLIKRFVLSIQNHIKAKYFLSGGSNILRAADHSIKGTNLITTEEGVMTANTIALLEKLFVKKNFLHDGQIPFVSRAIAKTSEERNTITDLLTYDTVGRQGEDPLGQDKDWESDMYYAVKAGVDGHLYKLKPKADGHLLEFLYNANKTG